MKFAELKKHLSGESLKACYTLTGDDRYLINLSIDFFNRLIEMPDFNLNKFDENAAISNIILTLNTSPMMSRYRLVIYSGFKNLPAEITEYLKEPNPDSILILEPKEDFKITAALKDTVVDCSYLDENMLINWIKSKAPDLIEDNACRLLTAYCNFNLSRISVELDKLLIYCDGTVINSKTVENMVIKDTEYKIYEFLECLAKKNADKAYEIMDALSIDAPPSRLIFSIYTHFRKLLFLKIGGQSDESFASYFGAKVFALKYLRQQAALYNAAALKNLVGDISDYDFKIKSGKITPESAVNNIIFKILAA